MITALAPTARASWSAEGNRVAPAAGSPPTPVLVGAPAGAVLATWLDARSGYNTDVFATLMTARGLPADGWTADGDLATNVTCRKYQLAAVSDGAGGALLAWSDNRCTGYRQIYAGRLAAAPSFAPGWPANGRQLAPTTRDQLAPALATDGAGGAFVAWEDARGPDLDLYLQHVDGAGAIAGAWPPAGLAVTALAGSQSAATLAADGAGGVYVAWVDARSGDADVYAQRITANGALAAGWPATGLPVCTLAGAPARVQAIADGSGGVVLTWEDARTGVADLFALRLLANGTRAPGWAAQGNRVCSAAGAETAERAVSDGAGGVFMAWQDHRGADWDVYAERLSGAGTPAAGWPATGVAIAAAAGNQTTPDLALDASSGAFIAWCDARAGGSDIWALRISAAGAPAPGWSAGGAPTCRAAGDQIAPAVAASGNEAMVAWQDPRDAGPAPAIFAQRLRADGPIPVRPSGLEARHHDGQTFLSWTSPPDTGWIHRVYVRTSPFAVDADLASATLVGSTTDSSAIDHRFHALTGTVRTFRVDSAAAPLAPGQGLFVVTVPAGRKVWYAVTSQQRSGPEDLHVVAGDNALTSSVTEFLGAPRPVYQGTIEPTSPTDLYTLWTWPTDTPLFPAMSNRASAPYDCGVVHAAPGAPALVRPHQRGGDFLGQLVHSFSPPEWVLGLDDYSRNEDWQTWWYGYHPAYDPFSEGNSPPTSGQVVDYTNRRALYTIRWWRATFPLDVARHYAFGYSMGGTCSMRLGLTHPELFPAVMSVVGKADFSFESDPDPTAPFNPGGAYRESVSRLFGTTATDLASSEGMPVYVATNDDSLAERATATGATFLMNFAGRHDNVVGWAEKPAFYQAMEHAKQGGAQFWDGRDHYGLTDPGGFMPMQDLDYLLRFRSDRSWPAFSGCSANSVPGNGQPASGDTLGTINGSMDWDPAVYDSAGEWRVRLGTRSLQTRWGVIPAPESLTVNVTPRRLQHFHPPPGTLVTWRVTRLPDGAILRTDTTRVDPRGVLTVQAVKVHRLGTLLQLSASPIIVAVGPGPPSPQAGGVLLEPFANPARRSLSLAGTWPLAAHAEVVLYDLAGRRARSLFTGDVAAGAWRTHADLSGLAPGVYIVDAHAGDRVLRRRLVLLR